MSFLATTYSRKVREQEVTRPNLLGWKRKNVGMLPAEDVEKRLREVRGKWGTWKYRQEHPCGAALGCLGHAGQGGGRGKEGVLKEVGGVRRVGGRGLLGLPRFGGGRLVGATWACCRRRPLRSS